MQKNVGTVDRTVRILLGSVMIAAALIFQGWWFLIGIVPLFTGIVGYCPLYSLFGLNTAEGYEFTVGYLAPHEVKAGKEE